MRQRTEYLTIRRGFEPQKVGLAIIAESPPASGKYFYDPNGSVSEPLFAALMKELDYAPATKERGLHEFQRRGWVLVDATYEPVNALTGAARDEVIARDYPLLREDLSALLPDRSTPLVLVKANVCKTLQRKLTDDGFNVLNNGSIISFPSHGHQTKFHQEFKAILELANISGGEGGVPQPRRARRSRRKKPRVDTIDSSSWVNAVKKVATQYCQSLNGSAYEFLNALQKEIEARNNATQRSYRTPSFEMGDVTTTYVT